MAPVAITRYCGECGSPTDDGARCADCGHPLGPEALFTPAGATTPVGFSAFDLTNEVAPPPPPRTRRVARAVVGVLAVLGTALVAFGVMTALARGPSTPKVSSDTPAEPLVLPPGFGTEAPAPESPSPVPAAADEEMTVQTPTTLPPTTVPTTTTPVTTAPPTTRPPVTTSPASATPPTTVAPSPAPPAGAPPEDPPAPSPTLPGSGPAGEAAAQAID